MARPEITPSKLAKPEARARHLKPSRTPYTLQLVPGLRLAYTRNEHAAGTWSALIANGKGGSTMKRLGAAAGDVNREGTPLPVPAGQVAFDFTEAKAEAHAKAKGAPTAHQDGDGTLKAAVDAYEQDLKVRGGELGNVARLRAHLSPTLNARAVAQLTVAELRQWRDGLAKTLSAATVNRTAAALKAALNRSADNDQRIASRQAWEIGLQPIPNATKSRNVILPPATVHAIVDEAYRHDHDLGLLLEVLAVTGTRVSQAAKLQIEDLQDERPDPRLMMPTSKKGRGKKAVTERPVPIRPGLAHRLRKAAGDRPGTAPLLLKDGQPWTKSVHNRRVADVVEAIGEDQKRITANALRHSSIVRQLLAGTPTRVVATLHDTSVAMIERTYSRYISDHTDSMVRGALLDTDAAPPSNVVALDRERVAPLDRAAG